MERDGTSTSPEAPAIAVAEHPTLENQANADLEAFRAAQTAISDALSQPSLPGAQDFETRRAELLGRAKAEPVFFVRTPEHEPTSDTSINQYRAQLYSARSAWDALSRILVQFASQPEQARAVLLREGYLYANEPRLAFALVSQVRPEHLFSEPQIWIHRAGIVMRASRRAVRKSSREQAYFFDDGPHAGEPVRLLHLDRLGSGTLVPPPLHREFRGLRERLGFERVRVRHIAEHKIVADLRYGPELWIATLLKADGANLELDREQVDPGQKALLQSLRDSALHRLRAVQALRHAILLQADERLPFDEPKTEYEQQDGTLRPNFQFAYREGRRYYEVNEDRYSVFDQQGRPLVPQVCMDFLLDSFERAGGSWWRKRGEVLGKTPGKLDFSEFGPRHELRRTSRLVALAKERSDLLELREFAGRERIEQGEKQQFFAYVAKNAHEFWPGDMIFIRGLTPWDEVEEHSHSFFIYETDPISGMPIAIAGNASVPSIWSWEAEARRTPHRTLRYRVRPARALLDRIIPSESLSTTPFPLVAGTNG